MRNARQASRDMDLLSRNVWRTKEQNYVTGLSGQEPRVSLELSMIVSPEVNIQLLTKGHQRTKAWSFLSETWLRCG